MIWTQEYGFCQEKSAGDVLNQDFSKMVLGQLIGLGSFRFSGLLLSSGWMDWHRTHVLFPPGIGFE